MGPKKWFFLEPALFQCFFLIGRRKQPLMQNSENWIMVNRIGAQREPTRGINKKSSIRGQSWLQSAFETILSITHPLLFCPNSRRQEESFNVFIGLEDGDRLTVFFNRTDWFQRTGWLFWIRIINGFLRIWSRRLSGRFFTETFLKRKKLIDIGI